MASPCREPVLDYPRLLARVREVVGDVRAHAALRRADRGRRRHRPRARRRRALRRTRTPSRPQSGLGIRAEKIIVCTGGTSRRLAVPGFELTATHSDAWSLTSVPPTMLVIGGGRDRRAGRVDLQRLRHARAALPGGLAHPADRGRRRVRGGRGVLSRGRHRGARGLRLDRVLRKDAGRRQDDLLEGRRARAAPRPRWSSSRWAGRPTRPGSASRPPASRPIARGFVRVDAHLRTSAPHIFAAGDVTGRLMLVPQAMQDGFVAATNAVRGPTMATDDVVSPIGSFTDPEYAQVGPDRGEGARDARCRGDGGALRRDDAHDHRRANAAASAS